MTGVTGMETADLIAEVVSMVKPDVVLVIDAWRQRISAESVRRFRSATAVSRRAPAWENRRREISGDARSALRDCHRSADGHRRAHFDSGCRQSERGRGKQAGIAQAPRCENLVADENRRTQRRRTRIFSSDIWQTKPFDMIVTSTDIDAVIQSFSTISQMP